MRYWFRSLLLQGAREGRTRLGPFTTLHSAFVHANLNWALGPFKYVLATPSIVGITLRWQHQFCRDVSDLGYPFFGTFRMPENRLPDNYGVDDQAFPSEIGGQLADPFRH
jgi:hypothetical protein